MVIPRDNDNHKQQSRVHHQESQIDLIIITLLGVSLDGGIT